MIGISISLYDKFDDLAILVDIIRNNWEDEYYISVCSNHPNAETRMEELNLDVDYFIKGSQIKYNSDMEGLREQINRNCRVYDSIKKAVTGAIESEGVSHVFHVHADAWPLSESKLKELISEMSAQEAVAAFKGKGLTHRGNRLVGHMMDQFFILDAKYASENEFFSHSPLELLPDRGLHTGLTILLLGKVGWSNVYFYSDQSEQEFWDGKPATGARPMAYNPDRDFLHLATEDFPNNLGKSLQACYLMERGITEGKFISELIDNHYLPRDQVVGQINDVQEDLDDKIRFFNVSDIGRNLRLAQEYLDKSPVQKMSFLFTGGINRVRKKIASLDPIIDTVINENVPRADPVAQSDPDEGIEDVYRRSLQEEDFPDSCKDGLWFTKDD